MHSYRAGHYQRVYVTDNAGLSRTSNVSAPVYSTMGLIVAYPRSKIFMLFNSRAAAGPRADRPAGNTRELIVLQRGGALRALYRTRNPSPMDRPLL